MSGAYDLAIVGAGPAGATLARLLAPGIRAIVIDPEERRGKPCGGLLAPDAQGALSGFDLNLPKDILVDPQIFSVRVHDLGSGLKRTYKRFYLNMDRGRFDRWLKSLIPDRVKIFDGICLGVERVSGGFSLRCRAASGREESVILAAQVVGADGANSIVRKSLFPERRVRQYIAIQQWFYEEHSKPFYSCIFDPETSDCCSWSISKDERFIYGGAFAVQGGRESFERQKEKLQGHGFVFGEPIKTESCLVSRPETMGQIETGSDGAYLIGESAGFISPSSLEGFSWAFESARILADTINHGGGARRYSARTRRLRLGVQVKLLKCPFMYRPALRAMVLKSGIKSIT